MNRLVTFISIFLLSSSDAGEKEKAFEVFWCRKPWNLYKRIVGEAGKAARDAAFPAQHQGVQQAVDTGLCLGFGAAGLARGSPGTATRVGAKMKDTERHPAAGFAQMLGWLPTVNFFSWVGTAFPTA